METTTLSYRKGKSDKIYIVTLEQAVGGYVVNYTHGKRLGTKQSGTKTTKKVTLDEARKIYDATIQSRLNHRETPYTIDKPDGPGSDVATYDLPAEPAEPTTDTPRVGCLLLTAVDGETGAKLILDDVHAAVEKFDGKRIILHATRAGVTGYNRKGQPCAIPTGVTVTAKARVRQVGEFMLDGELVGETYIVFDVLEHERNDYREVAYRDRQTALATLLGTTGAIRRAEVAYTTKAKTRLLEELYARNAEGIVFRRLDSPYREGRQRDQFKNKFYETASCVVTAINERRSVQISLFNDTGKLIKVGNVSVASNKTVPAEGDVIEVRYLYAFRYGSLYQPTFLGVRDDLEPAECLHSQLKFKADVA